jgi:hypothetical protein
MTTGRAVGIKAVTWAAVTDTTAWGYRFRARSQIGLADLPASRNDIEEFVTHRRSCSAADFKNAY